MAEETQTTNVGFELKLDDGSVVKAANVEEAVKIIAKMKTDTSAALKAERAEREQLAAQVSALQQDVTRRNQPQRDQNAFDRDQYYKLVGDDPIAAQNYLDSFRFGIPDPAQVPQYFQDSFASLTRMQQESLGANFVSTHPDFPPSAQTAEILTNEAKKLVQEGHPLNLNTMEIAWQNCLASEAIKPIEPAEEPESPNPSLSGGGSGALEAEASRIESDVASGKMSMKDFENYLRSKGMFGGTQ